MPARLTRDTAGAEFRDGSGGVECLCPFVTGDATLCVNPLPFDIPNASPLRNVGLASTSSDVNISRELKGPNEEFDSCDEVLLLLSLSMSLIVEGDLGGAGTEGCVRFQM